MLDRIRLHHFRNHAETTIAGAARFNLLLGENGAGKTNVLEAISLLAPGRGLRRAALIDMAANPGPGAFTITAELTQPSGEAIHLGKILLGTGTTPDHPSRRRIRINGADAAASSLSEWLGIFWLTPAMDRLFADTPGTRRRFMDRMALALTPAHAAHASRYEAALRERNRLLALPDADPRWFDHLEAQMAEAGAALASARAAQIDRLATALAAEPPSPFARPTLTYQPGGPLTAPLLAEALAATRAKDRAAQRSLTGPHRDDLAVMLTQKPGASKGQPAADCSTGEQKAMLIAITLAHADLSAHANPGADLAPPDAQRPRLLLLDEVAAHLDAPRRDALFERLAAGSAQVWITGTEATPFAWLAGQASCWKVRDGTVQDHEI